MNIHHWYLYTYFSFCHKHVELCVVPTKLSADVITPSGSVTTSAQKIRPLYSDVPNAINNQSVCVQ